jgi:carotenoid 1,2-hydratase
VFSPYYYWAGRRDPENHICLNVCLYGPVSRWSMTERGRAAGARSADEFRIGPSRVAVEDGAFIVEIAERAVPHLSPIRGRVRIIPEGVNRRVFHLDAPGLHSWRPIAPAARCEVEMDSPAQSWSGHAYLDSNWGSEPLEDGFPRWDWSRASFGDGRSAILYDITRRDGTDLSLALRFDAHGAVEEAEAPPRRKLSRTLWRVNRNVQADADAEVREVRRLEDAPFYARAELKTRLWGEDAHAVHETVDGDRFATRWVKLLLPWRMPRIAFGGG